MSPVAVQTVPAICRAAATAHLPCSRRGLRRCLRTSSHLTQITWLLGAEKAVSILLVTQTASTMATMEATSTMNWHYPILTSVYSTPILTGGAKALPGRANGSRIMLQADENSASLWFTKNMDG